MATKAAAVQQFKVVNGPNGRLAVLLPKRSVKVRADGTIRGWNKLGDLLDVGLKGQTFQFEGGTYLYAGDNEKARKYSVIVQRVSDGVFFKMAAPVVARAFLRVDEAA
jgi:hypothetical protein